MDSRLEFQKESNAVGNPVKKQKLREKIENAMESYTGKITVLPSTGVDRLKIIENIDGLHKYNKELNLWIRERDNRLSELSRRTGKSRDYIAQACNGKNTLKAMAMKSLRKGMAEVEKYERV